MGGRGGLGRTTERLVPRPLHRFLVSWLAGYPLEIFHILLSRLRRKLGQFEHFVHSAIKTPRRMHDSPISPLHILYADLPVHHEAVSYTHLTLPTTASV